MTRDPGRGPQGSNPARQRRTVLAMIAPYDLRVSEFVACRTTMLSERMP